MNQPNDKPPTLEERVADLEKLFGEIIKNEQELIKLSQRHRFNLQQISGGVNGLTLDMGDVRERFDIIEGKMVTKEDLATYQAENRERFDAVERAQAEQSQKLDLILKLLQPKGEL